MQASLKPCVIDVLYFADRQVKQKLKARLVATPRLLLVVAVRQPPGSVPPSEREPFRTLEREYGAFLDQLILADEGKVEGMWRDPLGELADELLPDSPEEAFLAASGYLLLQRGTLKATVRKRPGSQQDLWFLREALSQLDERVPPPNPKNRPGRSTRRPEPPLREPPKVDAWARLGIERGAPLSEARKAFRALIAQYHPDKVAHLAPEFRALAEARTREILAAWEEVLAVAEEGGK
jgi:DnaJ-domain-containing protein 1